jgi:hypothetical protein
LEERDLHTLVYSTTPSVDLRDGLDVAIYLFFFKILKWPKVLQNHVFFQFLKKKSTMFKYKKSITKIKVWMKKRWNTFCIHHKNLVQNFFILFLCFVFKENVHSKASLFNPLKIYLLLGSSFYMGWIMHQKFHWDTFHVLKLIEIIYLYHITYNWMKETKGCVCVCHTLALPFIYIKEVSY